MAKVFTVVPVTRESMSEACDQAANLYEQLARDRVTRGTADALRAAARALEAPVVALPAPKPGPDLGALLAAVSVTIGLREHVSGGRWVIDDEQMTRLESTYAAMKHASTDVTNRSPRGPR